ncbi:GGDEF domain-containing protein [Lachnoclostridium pacaense]|uniref:GGDEF domain-containing protein n=1 Tax=Enterocloster hominis (ex Hitch et al. 2024) TaxID=1917870 RepID=UPI001D105506|nr:GGDEF domain-containing protein [Lachnoclostridium pacaense]MCC2818421.1 GGDEF domain-containing protein [Lachnoclostridium pacaense]
MKKMDELQVENDRLRILARHDSLTGLLNRGAMEEEVGDLLKNKKGGIFLMLDVDHFKDINDVYGHLTGDLVLQELARIMGFLFFKKDIIGRMGGDEFAIFIPGEYRNELVDSKVERLHSRAVQAGKDMGIGNSLKLTIGADLVRKNDTFRTLYRRADLALRIGKQQRKKALYLYESSMEDCHPDSAARNELPAAPHDMRYICRQLKEPEFAHEAGSQDYRTFLAIFRFLERNLGRTGLNVQIILISVTDQFGSFVALEEREFLTGRLKDSICSSLRFGDLYTRYSSCQFLIMTPGAACENMEQIIMRIQKKFQESISDRKDIKLFFSFYPLQQTTPKKQDLL